MILIYTTFKDKKECEKMALLLINRKLIACANFFPSNSVYVWNNTIKKENEFILIGKTTDKKYKDVVKLIEMNHSYETPCIIKIKVKANKKFDKWISSIVR